MEWLRFRTTSANSKAGTVFHDSGLTTILTCYIDVMMQKAVVFTTESKQQPLLC